MRFLTNHIRNQINGENSYNWEIISKRLFKENFFQLLNKVEAQKEFNNPSYLSNLDKLNKLHFNINKVMMSLQDPKKIRLEFIRESSLCVEVQLFINNEFRGSKLYSNSNYLNQGFIGAMQYYKCIGVDKLEKKMLELSSTAVMSANTD